MEAFVSTVSSGHDRVVLSDNRVDAKVSFGPCVLLACQHLTKSLPGRFGHGLEDCTVPVVCGLAVLDE